MWYLLIPIALYLLYKLSMLPYAYWEKRGVLSKKAYPLVGNAADFLFQKESVHNMFIDVYKEFENERYFGNYAFFAKSLIIIDPELAKQILVKDFDHFTDHSGSSDENLEPIFTKNLFQLKGERWRNMRSVLSPAFTSSKMKAMFHLMVECAKGVPKYLEKLEHEEIDLKDLFTRYSNDVIATCAFGVTCDSLHNKENEFYVMGKEATSIQGWRTIKLIIMSFAPVLFKLFKVEVFPTAVKDFFYNMIKETIVYRTKNDIVRPDMIHLLLEARKGKLKHDQEYENQESSFAVVEESSIGKKDAVKFDFTDMDIVSQAFIFFFAGFETTSAMLSFFAIELAHNPDIQNKLRQEIDEMMDKSGDNPSYDDIIGMKYMDMCVSESLRKWPPAIATDRLCNKAYFIPAKRPCEKDLLLDKDISISIPILAFHRDPRYFSDPNKFDPERFNDENREKIIPFTYLPFGLGPRACIGSRFALLEIKVLMAFILRNFELCESPKVPSPLELNKGLKIEPINGFLVNIRPRKDRK